MKRNILVLSLFLLLFSATKVGAYNYYYGSFDYFYTSLQNQGNWIEFPGGVIAWKPYTYDYNWAPYKYGRWLWTTQGWYWDSNEPYGHIVYHYGRWSYDDYYGWLWYPGYDWAPAWVEWRYDNIYVGWAPLPPQAMFNVSFGINYINPIVIHHHHWHYVKVRHFCDHNLNHYYVNNSYKQHVYNRTKRRTQYSYRNNRVVNEGLNPDQIRRVGGKVDRQRDITFEKNKDRQYNRTIDRDKIVVRERTDVERPKRYDFDKSYRESNVRERDVEHLRDKDVTERNRTDNNGGSRIITRERTEKEHVRYNIRDDKNNRNIDNRVRNERESNNRNTNGYNNSDNTGRTNTRTDNVIHNRRSDTHSERNTITDRNIKTDTNRDTRTDRNDVIRNNNSTNKRNTSDTIKRDTNDRGRNNSGNRNGIDRKRIKR